MNTLHPTTQKKIDKVLSCNLNDPQLIASLEALSEFYKVNSLVERRKLTSVMEQRQLDSAQEFLGTFHTLVEDAHKLTDQTGAIAEACNETAAGIDECSKRIAPFISALERIEDEQRFYRSGIDLLDKLDNQYKVSEDDEEILRGDTVSSELFCALARLREVLRNCKTLAVSQFHQAGTLLVGDATALLDKAHATLATFVKGYVPRFSVESPTLDTLFQRALAELHGTALFEECLRAIATERGRCNLYRFQVALSVGGPGGFPPPIERSAHEPFRYVSDLLGWTHQTVASETELFTVLLSAEGNGGTKDATEVSSGTNSDTEKHGNGAKHVATLHETLLDAALGPLAEPLRLRIFQVYEQLLSTTQVFKLAQLVDFYRTTIASATSTACPLCTALDKCHAEATRVFTTQISATATKLREAPPVPHGDLAPPTQVTEVCKLIDELLKSRYETVGMSDSEDISTSLADRLITPLLTSAFAGARQVLRDSDAISVYLINVTDEVIETLSQYGSMNEQCEGLGEQVDGQLDAMVAAHARATIARAGLGTLLRCVDENAAVDGVVLAQTHLNLHLLADDAFPKCDLIRNFERRKSFKRRLSCYISSKYRLIYEAVCAFNGNTTNEGKKFLSFTPNNIDLLLGLESTIDGQELPENYKITYKVIHDVLTDDNANAAQTEQEKENICALFEKFGITKPAATEENKKYVYVGAWIESHPIGCSTIIQEESGKFSIKWFTVVEKFRHCGIATKMLNEFIHSLQQNQKETIVVTANAKRMCAKRLLERNGFRDNNTGKEMNFVLQPKKDE